MSVNSAMLEAMQAEGLSLDAIIRIVRASEKKADATNAARQARHRAKRKEASSNAVTVTGVTPPNDIDTLTPLASETEVSSATGRPWSRPDGVDEQVWKDFLGNRKRKSMGNTPTSWKRFKDDLDRISAETKMPAAELIEHAAAKGWGGIYDPRGRDAQQKNDPYAYRREPLRV